ncbi:unnamed protein product, partial [Mesorhabditis spiculigera]
MPRPPTILLLAAVVAFLTGHRLIQAQETPDPSLLPPVAFSVAESAPIGYHIGFVEGAPQPSLDARYFVVATDPDKADSYIHISEQSGEITVKALLDYETQRRFEFVVIPIGGGAGIPVTINVEDENDNEPVFTQPDIRIDISEFVRIGAEFPLPSAIDHDGPPLDVRSYRIVQGNVNNVFKLASKRINNILYADLVVNGRLDREYRESYHLIIEAVDGGNPPRSGELQVSILILDANDNAPEFSEKVYHATITPDHPMDKTIITIKATDKDTAHNGQLGYRIAQPSSPVGRLFSIAPTGGITKRSISKLPPGTFEFVVIAADHGIPPQESSVVVSVTVEGQVGKAPTLDVLWLTDDTDSRLPENSTLGSIVARVNVTNYDPEKHGKVELTGCPSLCLQQAQHPSVYLVILCGLLDREMTSEYHLRFLLKKEEELIMEHPVVLTIEDINDNIPEWHQKNYHLALNRTISDPEDPQLDLSAVDGDAGSNGRLRYWIEGTDVIAIDEDTGRLHYATELDCSIGSEIRFRVHATDKGQPPLTSHVQVTAEIVDSSGKPPQFDRSLYSERIQENVEVGTCIFKRLAHSVIGRSI